MTFDGTGLSCALTPVTEASDIDMVCEMDPYG